MSEILKPNEKINVAHRVLQTIFDCKSKNNEPVTPRSIKDTLDLVAFIADSLPMASPSTNTNDAETEITSTQT